MGNFNFPIVLCEPFNDSLILKCLLVVIRNKALTEIKRKSAAGSTESVCVFSVAAMRRNEQPLLTCISLICFSYFISPRRNPLPVLLIN